MAYLSIPRLLIPLCSSGLRPNGEIERRQIEADLHTGLTKCRNFRREDDRKGRKTFRFTARQRARVLTCDAEKVGRKLKIRPRSLPRKVFGRLPEMDSFEASSSAVSAFGFPLPLLFFRGTSLARELFIGRHSDALVYYLQV